MTFAEVILNGDGSGRLSMKRRDFLKSTGRRGRCRYGDVGPPAIWSPAKAQSRQETLLIVSESGPQQPGHPRSVGTNVPGYEVSWNCYDRLISHEMKTVNGTPYYDRDKFKMELAEDMNVGPMSATFKLKKDATFQDGAPVTAKDVKWSLDRAVSVGGFPTFQMGAGSLTKPEQFVVVDDHTFRVDFMQQGPAHRSRSRRHRARASSNSELVKSKRATEKDPWGLEYTKLNTAGSGAYRGRELDTPAPKSSWSATRAGKAARCPRSNVSFGASCRPPAIGARCLSGATPTSPTICRTRISPSSRPTASSPSSRHHIRTASNTSA